MMHLNRPNARSSDDAVVHTTSSAGYRIHPVRKRDMRKWEALACCHNMALYVEPVDNPAQFCGSDAIGGAIPQFLFCCSCVEFRKLVGM